jgi:hypothetical protein
VTHEAEIDLSDREFWLRPLAERESAFEILRAQPGLPFFPEPEPAADWMPHGPGYFADTRHADVAEASRRSDVFLSGPGARPFQDHDVSPRMVNGRSMKRPAHRVASVTSMRPAMRSAPIARLRRAAMTLGPDLVLTWDLSS